jgi:hypothetical protein
MWALALAVVLLLMPFVHGFTAGNRERPNRLNVVMQPVLALVLAGFWVGLVLDQMPCFLRVPNCD